MDRVPDEAADGQPVATETKTEISGAELTLEPSHNESQAGNENEQVDATAAPASAPAAAAPFGTSLPAAPAPTPTPAPAPTPLAETSRDFTHLSSDEVSLILYLRCHDLGHDAIGRMLAHCRETRKQKERATAATAAVIAKLHELEHAPPISTSAARQVATNIAQKAIPDFKWHLTHAKLWDAEERDIINPGGEGGPKAAARRRLDLRKWRARPHTRGPYRNTKAGRAQEAEQEAEVDTLLTHGYDEGDRQELEDFLLDKLRQLMTVI